MGAYAKAQAELSDIDARIAVLQQRREALRQFVALGRQLYGGGEHVQEIHVQSSDVFRVVAARASATAAQTMSAAEFKSFLVERSNKARILSVCRGHIGAHGPTSTRDLLAILEGAGVTVTGNDKVNTLSVILSKSDEFESDRRLGWSLRSTSKEENPQDVAASAGSDVEVSQLSLTGGSGTSAG